MPHALLLKDIELDSHIVQWISSYLSDRKQYVVVEGTSSDSVSVVSGVPQGSVLGSLLFLTYINCVELPDSLRLSMYANVVLWLWSRSKTLAGALDEIGNFTFRPVVFI